MIFATAAASIGIFAIALWRFGILKTGTQALHTGRRAIAILTDDTMGDDAREAVLQHAALQLLGSAVSILGRSLLAVTAAMAPILAADWAGLASQADLMRFLARWDVILIVSVVLTAAYLVWMKVCHSR